MIPKLQIILDQIKQAENIPAAEKEFLIKAIHDADKAQSMVQFKLDRIEKDRNTLSIMLEETIDDLQKKTKAVEAQNRELEIETALERVRTVAMSMMKSDELLKICESVFNELRLLGFSDIDLRNVQIVINNDEKGMYNGYQYADYSGGEIAEVPYELHPVIRMLNNKLRQSSDAFADIEISGKELDDWKTFVNNFPQKHDDKLNAAAELHYYFYSVGIGALGISSFIPLQDEKLKILQRLRNVFNLSYQRYTDIALAEAQTREAQIELALERVRARAMSMQKSDELTEAANLLFHQVQSLGMQAWSTGYCIWNEDRKSVTLWMSSEGVLQPPFQAPTTEDELFIQMRKGHEEGKTLHVVEMGGKKLEAHYRYMRTLPVVGKIFDSILEAGHPLPTFQVMHYAYFSKGYLLFITYQSVPDAHEIFKRFASVFDQTYTRFLDLQKAEAQAREAQIEAALEKVRSRSMGMQKSEELKEVIKLVYHQLIHLKINLDHAGFVVDYKQKGDWHFWIADEHDIPSKISHPYFESVWATQFNEAKQKGADSFITNLNFEEKNKFYNELLSYVPG
jgi:coenzyme F420-reducing hydrogenase delta subunit